MMTLLVDKEKNAMKKKKKFELNYSELKKILCKKIEGEISEKTFSGSLSSVNRLPRYNT